MGCSPSKAVDAPGKNAQEQNQKIERALRQDRKQESRTVKILLLGAGESGKSTIIKQMRIIHNHGFQEDERRQIRAVIYSNVVIACRVLLEIMRDEGIEYEDEKTKDHAGVIDTTDNDLDAEEAFSDMRVKEAMLRLWKDAGVQKAIAKGHEFALNDNLTFYFQNIDRMFDPDWIPDDQDMLRARLRTTGITETIFELNQLTFRMMDVGGQRSERKKWIHCFEGVQCLLFMAALSGYDQCLVEDVHANQMHEALMLFESLINGQWFKDKPIILFLNKVDLFRQKLKLSPIKAHFPDYKGGPDDEKAAREYFANRFKAINKNPNREIYIHFTNATDTTLLKATMDSVQDVLVQRNIHRLVL